MFCSSAMFTNCRSAGEDVSADKCILSSTRSLAVGRLTESSASTTADRSFLGWTARIPFRLTASVRILLESSNEVPAALKTPLMRTRESIILPIQTLFHRHLTTRSEPLQEHSAAFVNQEPGTCPCRFLRNSPS